MMALAENALRGSFPPLVTPFTDSGEIDTAAYARLVEAQVRGGSPGIVVTGTTGEPSTLGVAERIRLLEVALEAAAGRLQVVAACGTQTHAESLEMLRAADRAGAAAMLVVTPYFIRPPQRGLEAYYLDLCRHTDRPVMIYHIPGRAGVAMSAETVARIAERAPNLVGIKHASEDLGFVTDLLAKLGPAFRVHVGLEELSFPMLCLGASGLMNAVGNLLPGAVQSLYAAVSRGELARGRALHFALAELNRAVFFDTNPIPMKYMMWRRGLLPRATHRLPMVPATPEVAARLDDVLARAEALFASS